MTLPKFTGFDHCETPPDVYAKLYQEFHFDCDPCPLQSNFDGLADDYVWGQSTYVNPPYSDLRPWVYRAVFESYYRKKTVVMLLKADTSTRIFQDMILPYAKEIRFMRGRLHFKPYDKPAPFASMIVVFRP